MWNPIHGKEHEGRQINLAFSPCPNDTFMMDAMVHNKLDTGFDLNVHLMDIQALNQAAMEGRFDVSKISAATFPLVEDQYDMLDAGAAMGFGCGPLIVAKKKLSMTDLKNSTVAIPGQHTTANYLFSQFYPEVVKKEFMPFSEIEEAVADGRVDAGVLIHESRFTFHLKGLIQLVDLGMLWDQKYDLPLPLGVLVCRKNLEDKLKFHINEAVRKSIQYAFDHPDSSRNYVLSHAQEMQPEIVDRHIALYVNSFSLSMGSRGKQAIDFLILQFKSINTLL